MYIFADTPVANTPENGSYKRPKKVRKLTTNTGWKCFEQTSSQGRLVKEMELKVLTNNFETKSSSSILQFEPEISTFLGNHLVSSHKGMNVFR